MCPFAPADCRFRRQGCWWWGGGRAAGSQGEEADALFMRDSKGAERIDQGGAGGGDGAVDTLTGMEGGVRGVRRCVREKQRAVGLGKGSREERLSLDQQQEGPDGEGLL